MKRKLFIVGAGTYAAELLSLVRKINDLNNRWILSGLIDDNKNLHGKTVFSEKVIGDFNFLKNYKEKADVVFAIGNTKVVTKMAHALKKKKNYRFPNVIDPTVLLESAKVGEGVVIFKNSIINALSNIGSFVTIGFNSIVGHHVIIEDFCFIASGVVINGCARISKGAFLGSNSTCVPSVKIGKYAKIGLGSAVMSPVKDGKTVVGIPAKPIF